MSKWMKWIALAALLLFLTGCRTVSSATVKVTNKGDVKIQVNISGSIMQIGPGQTGTFDFTWDGRNPSIVQLLAYPVGDPNNFQAQTLELNHGDVLSIDIKLTGN
jgi:hypothetical protein